MADPNPYDAAFPIEPEPKESGVPWLAIVLILGATLLCSMGIAYAFLQKRAAANSVLKAKQVLDEENTEQLLGEDEVERERTKP